MFLYLFIFKEKLKIILENWKVKIKIGEFKIEKWGLSLENWD